MMYNEKLEVPSYEEREEASEGIQRLSRSLSLSAGAATPAFALADSRFYYVTSPRQPSWIREVAVELAKLLDLEAGWGGRSSEAISEQNVASAFDLLNMIAVSNTPRPDVVPTVVGGVQLDWSTVRADLEIEIVAPFRLHVLWENHEDESIEEIEVVSDYERLVRWVRAL